MPTANEVLLADHGLALGINPDLGNTAYHSGPGVSCSDLKMLIDRTPAHLAHRKANPTPSTDAMAVGNLFHTMVLEPEKLESRFGVLPEGMDLKGAVGKQFKAATLAAGKTFVRHSNVEDVRGMAEAVRRHPAANALLNRQVGTSYEQPIYYVDPETGLLGKIKPDVAVANEKLKLIIDLKKCQDASPAGFMKTIANYRYDFQAAKYLHGANCAFGGGFERFVFIAVEEEPPHCVGCYVATYEMVAKGMEAVRYAFGIYQECYESGNWPGYSTKIEDIDLPPWRQ